jgi:Ca2+-binding RTX toxin-like protein
MKRLLLAVILFAAVLTLPTQADFFLCNPNCTGTPNADLMNGTDANNAMGDVAGNDIMFGGDGIDSMNGDQGDDIMFGGNDWDIIFGGPGNDTLLPGPDGMESIQQTPGGAGNDMFIVLVGETSNCQIIFGDPDFDVLHLIGFGPYVTEYPFSQPEPVVFPSWVVIQDPVAGGFIFVMIGDGPGSLERINGLPSPNITVLDDAAYGTFQNQNCINNV